MSLLRKLCLVVGVTAAGECQCVYAGRNADEALKALRGAPAELLDVGFYKRPRPAKRRKPEHGSAEAIIETEQEDSAEDGEDNSGQEIPVTGDGEEAAVDVPIGQAEAGVDEAAQLVGGATEAPVEAAPKAKGKAAPKAKKKQ
jgi:hypothetical protein